MIPELGHIKYLQVCCKARTTSPHIPIRYSRRKINQQTVPKEKSRDDLKYQAPLERQYVMNVFGDISHKW